MPSNLADSKRHHSKKHKESSRKTVKSDEKNADDSNGSAIASHDRKTKKRRRQHSEDQGDTMPEKEIPADNRDQAIKENDTIGNNQEDNDRKSKKRRRRSEDNGPEKDSQQQEDNVENETTEANDDNKEDPGLVAFPNIMTGKQEPKKEEVQLLRSMGIPDWLLQPTVISPEQSCDLEQPGLSERLVQRCRELGISNFFAVQMAVIPVFLRRRAFYDTRRAPGDLCVSAPTGSGKTLAYVLPIVDILSKRVVRRLRALVILPTRELAIQVKETFEAFVKGTDLAIGSSFGQHTLAHDQQTLVGKNSDEFQGGVSRVDILVTTPGRLTDHIKSTPNFSLQHLRFLVIDEADRLLNESFNDWLNQILTATHPPERDDAPPLSFREDSHGVPLPDAIAPNWLRSRFSLPRTDLDLPKAPTVQKLLFSATLTKDPAKIASLHLTDPEYISVQRATTEEAPLYTTPPGLTEYMSVCTSQSKPLILIYLLHQYNIKSCLCFTKSIESTQRLKLLVEAFEKRQNIGPKLVVAEYSSDLNVSERKAILKRFHDGEITILICSDLIGRGIDLDNVQVVISYDAPRFMDKYIHRVGRTARAGREGTAYTLVESQDAKFFKNLLREAGHLQQVKRLHIQKEHLQKYTDTYQAALDSLQ